MGAIGLDIHSWPPCLDRNALAGPLRAFGERVRVRKAAQTVAIAVVRKIACLCSHPNALTCLKGQGCWSTAPPPGG